MFSKSLMTEQNAGGSQEIDNWIGRLGLEVEYSWGSKNRQWTSGAKALKTDVVHHLHIQIKGRAVSQPLTASNVQAYQRLVELCCDGGFQKPVP